MAELIAAVPEPGGILAVTKALILLVLVAPWLYFAPWVNRDTGRAHASQPMWNAIVLGAGALGVLLWLLMPFYVVGALFYVVLAGGGIGAYVVYRNGRVPDDMKVLTRKHLQRSMRPRRRQQIEIFTKVTIYDTEEKVVFPPDMTVATREELETYNRLQDLLYDLIWRRASEVGLTPAGERCRVLYVIDGVATERPSLTLTQSEAMIQFLKPPAGMDVEEHRRPQKGALSVDLQGQRSDMELSCAGTTGGQRLRFRVIQEVARTRLDELGMPADILEKVRAIAQARNGLFLVSGRRGSGVTSTLYSILRERDAFIDNVTTIEASPAVDLENISQQPYSEDGELPETLTAASKRGFDVLMVDNCPNAETAGLIVKIAAKRPVLLGMQANDSFQALAKWVKVCGGPTDAVKALRAVMCQMLLRRLCEDCRESYRPDPKRLAKLNLSGEKIGVFYRPPAAPGAEAGAKDQPEVCQTCQASGYRGRTAAFELLELNDDIRRLIIDGATVAHIRAACRKNGMLYLQEQALRKVIDGSTSVQEVVRISQQAKKR